MLKYALACLGAALIAAVLGFGGVSESGGIAQVVFMICIGAFVALLAANAGGGRTR